jgi:hypothetical protein
VLRVLSAIGTALILSLVSSLAPAFADSGYQSALVRQSLEPPYLTQLDRSIYAVSDCGPAVLGMVLADYGLDEDTLHLRELTHIYQGTWPAVRVGTALQYVAQVAEDFGLSAYGLYDDVDAGVFHQWSSDEIVAQLSGGSSFPWFGSVCSRGTKTLVFAGASTSCSTRCRTTVFCTRIPPSGRSRMVVRYGSAALSCAMAPVYPARQAVAFGS